MRASRITGVDRASLIAWPGAWAGLYYAVTFRATRGEDLHPIQAGFLVLGMILTGLLAAAAAGIWLSFLARRGRHALAPRLGLREVTAYGCVGGAAPMAVLVCLNELAYTDSLRPVTMLGAVASAGLAGALSAIITSGIVALRRDARA